MHPLQIWCALGEVEISGILICQNKNGGAFFSAPYWLIDSAIDS